MCSSKDQQHNHCPCQSTLNRVTTWAMRARLVREAVGYAHDYDIREIAAAILAAFGIGS